VQYPLAYVLNHKHSTNVQKNAVAAAECLNSAFPLPLAICVRSAWGPPQIKIQWANALTPNSEF
jgi:hypothetical protein